MGGYKTAHALFVDYAYDCFSHASNSASVSFPASHLSRFSLALSLQP